MQTNSIAIKLTNISKYYKLYNAPKDRLKEALSISGKQYHKKFYATKNLNLEIKKGEVLGIVGKNGSGKSTLLKLITGVLTPDEGSIEVNGKISALLELGSGFNPEFTGMQNIFFYGTILGFTKQEMEEKLDNIIAFADIGDFIYQPLKTYSSGMKSRLGFAVAVHIDPEILILDEVLSVGDLLFRRKCYAKMEEFFKGGKTIIYVSHDSNSINELCTRAIFLLDGNIILDADAKTVTTFYQKYIFSNKEDQKQIIINLSTNSINVKTHKDSYKIINTNKMEKNNLTEKAYFIKSFQTSSLKVVQNYSVDIIQPKILTKDNEQVNMLIMGEEYFLTYILKVPLSIKNLSYGAQIKGINGQLISNASLKNANTFVELMKPGEYLVTWSFTCLLTPNTYYIDTSTTGIVNIDREVLFRGYDHVIFKVIKQKETYYQGIVTLNQEIKHEKN